MSNDHGEFDEACTESETTCTVGKLSSRKPREPGNIRFFYGSGSVGEGARPQVRHGRYREVTQFHSTEEDQRTRAGCQGLRSWWREGN